jgi:hypothetical protein
VSPTGYSALYLGSVALIALFWRRRRPWEGWFDLIFPSLFIAMVPTLIVWVIVRD